MTRREYQRRWAERKRRQQGVAPRSRPDVICPECAGPKFRQSKRCRECYYAARRRGEYAAPPVLRGSANPRWSGGPKQRTGRSSARPQPQSHPWRKTNGLLKGNR